MGQGWKKARFNEYTEISQMNILLDYLREGYLNDATYILCIVFYPDAT